MKLDDTLDSSVLAVLVWLVYMLGMLLAVCVGWVLVGATAPSRQPDPSYGGASRVASATFKLGGPGVLTGGC